MKAQTNLGLYIISCFVFGLVLNTAVVALVPPLQENATWESAHEMRRRLNVTFAYEPRYVDPELCRHLTEAQCREQDEGLGHATANHRRLNAPNTGDVNVLVLLCRFRDHIGVKLPSREHFEELFNGDGPSDLNPVGSIKEWLYYNSVGKYRVTFDVQDWFTLPHNEAYYAGGVSGLQGPAKMQEVFAPKLDDLYQSGYDFRTLDSKGWGVLDHLVAIHSGYGAELGDPIKPELAGCVPPATDRIWSQGIGFTAGGWNSVDFAYAVSPFILTGAYDPVVCDNKPANMAIIAHEYMHGFGLIDVYDQDKDEAPIFIGGLGRFCSMAALYGWNRNLKFPGHLSPFSRAAAGWIEPFEIVEDGSYPIQASELSNQVYVIKKNFPDQEFLYIENRQAVKWDQDWPSSGIVIYHVELLAPKQQERGYPDHPNFPKEHYQVSVIQRDGKFDIERGNNPGDVNDFWQKGMVLKSGCDAWPNSCSYQGGVLRSTGIEIKVETDSGFIMSFAVTGLNNNNQQGSNKAEPVLDVRLKPTDEQQHPETVGTALTWLIEMLSGVAVLIGFIIVFV